MIQAPTTFPGSTRTRQELQTRMAAFDKAIYGHEENSSNSQWPPEADYLYPTPNDSDWNFVWTDHPHFEGLVPGYKGDTLGQMQASAIEAEQKAYAAHEHDESNSKESLAVGGLCSGALVGLFGGMAANAPGVGLAIGAACLGGLGLYEWQHNSRENAHIDQMHDAEFFQQKLPRWGRVLDEQPKSA